jgi:nitrogenase iron protein NifH
VTISKALKVVLYGKGGVGKSTVATHLGMAYAERGLRVLHVGCDPKQDSSLRLTDREDVPTLLDFIEDGSLDSRRPKDLIVKGTRGIDTIEAGGPEPGVGCAGRGVATLVDFLDLHGIDSWPYDVRIFDVLGDLVCGGFVSPIRYAMGNRVLIVASGELMSLYAANRIASVVLEHVDEGVRLAGIVFNLKSEDEHVRESLERFAARIRSRVLGFVPWSPVVREAERLNKTAFDHAPDSEICDLFRELADRVQAPVAPGYEPPQPMDRKEFLAFGRGLDL